MNIPILFENENLLVVNKPAGLIVHNDGKNDEPSLVDWILEKYPEIEGVGENMYLNHKNETIEINRPGIVHRIDRDTSGCLLVAKNQETFLYLKGQFKEKQIKKAYRALSYENIVHDRGVIEAPIGRHGKDFRKKTAGAAARGELREAKTYYQVISRHKDVQGRFYTFLECYPVTGRTHQIRVHLQFKGNPIVADSLYKGRHKEDLHIKRMALHAYRIAFKDASGDVHDVVADFPADINTAFDHIKEF